MFSTRKRRIQATVAAVGITGGLTFGGVATATATDTTAAAGERTSAACVWDARKPVAYKTKKGNGKIKAKLYVKGCGKNRPWFGQLQSQRGPLWIWRGEPEEWNGNEDHWARFDCADGETYNYRAIMRDADSGHEDISPVARLTCPGG
ncbi:hypothetical protein DVA86_31395 [Streptomyces armeniacus]|uniref:Uncharacterized protein n=1 Tax=Streptomyces armeniacus TaxID=83291 RepID=A0A345XXQ5_9ACTN|nr:hypothetical protein [Streptomyces armeniacus]AXK36421.1 hypothetical protein DVA86_31395 [Streptomyces armeniacus]